MHLDYQANIACVGWLLWVVTVCSVGDVTDKLTCDIVPLS